MKAKQTTFQAPRPEVRIYSPFSDKYSPKLVFDKWRRTGFQEYSFKTSVDDVRGQFSLTFYPDDEYGDPIFDEIKELDIAVIYETKSNIAKTDNYTYKEVKFKHKDGNQIRYIDKKLAGQTETYGEEAVPVFVGVIRSKKYASQIGASSSRKLVVSGHSVVGLVSDFYMNMDLSAQVITEEMAAQNNVQNALTISLLEKGISDIKVDEIIKTIWKEFIKLSRQYGKLSNPVVGEILAKWSGDDFFDIDERLSFHYPLGCVFNGKTTQGFFDIVGGIIPEPVYEKFAYMDRSTGNMRLKIRECPFDADDWDALEFTCNDPDTKEIPMRLVKSLNIEQSDNEVYTVFFSYLDGYPVQEDKLIILAKQNQEGMSAPALVCDEEKFKKYGYRLLSVHFIGYGKIENEDDTYTEEKLQKLNQRLMDWYQNLELMYNGTLTLATDLSMNMPQAGEKIKFLGGEFYVTGAEHRWSYKGNPETILTISRGGIYGVKDAEREDNAATEKNEPPKTYIVKQYDKITVLAPKYNSTVDLILGANQSLLAGRVASEEGLPTIYAGDKLTIPPDPGKAEKKEDAKSGGKKEIKFDELKYWGRSKSGGATVCRSLM